MIVLPEERATLTAEQRAWSEYLAWTRNAAPSEYTQTEQLAWFRLERALLTLRLRHYKGARLSPPAPGKALVTVRHTPRPLGGGGA